jgi:hypothetical protein
VALANEAFEATYEACKAYKTYEATYEAYEATYEACEAYEATNM